jgi:hypothetical protein
MTLVLARFGHGERALVPTQLVKRRFVIACGATAGDAFVVRDGATVGRSRGVDFSLPEDERVSARHFEMRVSPGGAVSIIDLGSRNGTLVDGRRIEPLTEVAIAPGTELVIGSTELRFEETVISYQWGDRTPADH